MKILKNTLLLAGIALVAACSTGGSGVSDPALLNNPGGSRAVVDKGEFNDAVSAKGVETIIIYGGRGPFRIHGSDTGEIAYRGTKEASSNAFLRGGSAHKPIKRARKAARRGLDETRIRHEREGDTLEFRLEAPEEDPGSFGSVSLVSVDLDFIVPRDINVLIETQHGVAEVENINGTVTVVQNGPAVVVRDVKGPVTVEAAYGPVVVGRIDGDVEVRCHVGNVVTQDITGNIRASADSGDIIHLSTRPPTHNASFRTHKGNIEAYYPAASDMVLSASAVGGEVKCNLPGLRARKREHTELAAVMGSGGPKMVFRASRGGINIQTDSQFPEFVDREMSDDEFEEAMEEFEEQKREGKDASWGQEGRNIEFN